VEQFAYPVNGTGSVYTRMMDKIVERGGKVHLGTPVEKVVTANNRVTRLRLVNGKEVTCDHVISTMPLTLLSERLGTMPEGLIGKVRSLKFRNTILAYLQIDRTDLFPDQWLYIHDAEVKTGRITNFRNWVPQLYGNNQQTILCMEYWCNFEDDLWKGDDEALKALATKEIAKIGLASETEVLDAHIFRIPRCYPVYFSGYQQMLQPVQEFLGAISNLHVIGRYGAYKYNNQDHSILMGMLAAENILNDSGHDLWEINTDYGVYQESATITKTGLKVTSDN